MYHNNVTNLIHFHFFKYINIYRVVKKSLHPAPDNYNTERSQKNGAVSKVNQKFISRPTRVKRIPSATATVKVSHGVLAVRFSRLL
jgi:hypothetical protein